MPLLSHAPTSSASLSHPPSIQSLGQARPPSLDFVPVSRCTVGDSWSIYLLYLLCSQIVVNAAADRFDESTLVCFCPTSSFIRCPQIPLQSLGAARSRHRASDRALHSFRVESESHLYCCLALALSSNRYVIDVGRSSCTSVRVSFVGAVFPFPKVANYSVITESVCDRKATGLMDVLLQGHIHFTIYTPL
jgi:hypothetical protein